MALRGENQVERHWWQPLGAARPRDCASEGQWGERKGRMVAREDRRQGYGATGGGERTTQGAAQAKAAALRRQSERDLRRRRALTYAGGAIAVVVVAIAVLVAVRLGGGARPKALPAASDAGKVAALVTSVPASTLDAVGVGTAQNLPAKIAGPRLTKDGKPYVLYVGAEFCPFCAAQRWGVAIALSRFGTWSNLGTTHSSPTDIYPNTASLSFHGATFTSSTVTFTGYETSDVQQRPLDTMSPADQQTFDTFDTPTYAGGAAGSIPFLDIGGTHVVGGASVDPQLLAGMSAQQVAEALADPANPIARAIDGSANAITAAICASTSGAPVAVCTSPGVKAAAAKLPTR